MTRKETLLQYNYELNNELNTLMGMADKNVDIESFVGTWAFQNEARKSTAYGIEESNKNLYNSIIKLRKEQEIKKATEAYYSSEEGSALKSELESKIEAKKQEYRDCETYTEDAINNWLADFLGEHWKVYYLTDRRLELTIIKSETERVFGTMIEITYGKDHTFKNREWIEVEKFEFNVGTTGSASIQATDIESRARFYIDLGKFLADAEKTEELREMLFDYQSTLETIRKELNELEARLENPTSL